MGNLWDIGLLRSPSWAGLHTGCLSLHHGNQEAGGLETNGGGVLEPCPCVLLRWEEVE